MNTEYDVIDNSGVEIPSNFSPNPHFDSVLQARLGRRGMLRGSIGAAVAAMFAAPLAGCGSDDKDSTVTPDPEPPAPQPPAPKLGFTGIATNRADTITVPAGYTAAVIAAWGTPITGGYPDFLADASNTGEQQEQQMGQNHDGIHFFPIDLKSGGNSSSEGLLVMNHEYIEQNVLHNGGADNSNPRPADQVRKEIAAHGVSIVHIKRDGNGVWSIQQSGYNRRITGATPMAIAGPVRGSSFVKTKYSTNGTLTRGTLNNCGNGYTPWGTYLTTEENWAGYFVNRDATRPREQTRYGVPSTNSRYRWETAAGGADEYVRFNAGATGASATDDYRNEPNTFGYIVEIDPFDEASVPVKRTTLGRFAHEAVVFSKPVEGKPLAFYSGDDSQNEYIYKFVTREAYYAATAGGYLLNSGTLYVAKFKDDGTGEWLPLDFSNSSFQTKMQEALTSGVLTAPFVSQADVLVNTRLAADVMGATKMDRPEWGALHPETGEVYFTLTNNTSRTVTDAANPRTNNTTGHIIRWRESNSDAAATTFAWDIFALAGDVGTTTSGTPALTLTADNIFASPDGLWIDNRGVLWIQTDMSGTQQSTGPYGNNQMLVADPETKEIRRFLVGPVDQEVTGITMTPDMKTMFVNIQHPGDRSTPTSFTSNWPDGGSSRPRSATVIITRNDGGIIGA